MKKNLLLMFTCFSIISAMQNEQLDNLIASFKGKVGIHAVNTETQQTISKNAREFFPMVSTRKIVLASYILDLIDQQALKLDQPIKLTAKDCVAGTGSLKNELIGDRVLLLTIKELLRLSMVISDNVAANKLMSLGGGHTALDSWIEQNGFKDIFFKTDISNWLLNHMQKTICFREGRKAILASNQAPSYLKESAQRLASSPEPETIDFFDEDTNIATPTALTEFIHKCYTGTAPGVSNLEYRNLLLNFMKNCETGKNRILKYLPDTTVMHKTGSGYVGICCDAGIIESTTKAPIILTIFVKDSTAPMSELEELIAKIALQVYNAL